LSVKENINRTIVWHPLIMLISIVLIMPEQSCAQMKDREQQIKAIYIINFTRFIEWPHETLREPDSPLIIGVIGDPNIYKHVETVIKGEKIGHRPIIIQQFVYPDQIKNCHFLYIGLSDPDQVRSILDNKLYGSAITISDEPNFLRWGGAIRFYNEKEKIRFEINTESSKKSNVKISSKLLNLAKIY
jgi:hypothetical protein